VTAAGSLGNYVMPASMSSVLFRPFGAGFLFCCTPRLAPLRQAQGKLWAAFYRRFAAGVWWASGFGGRIKWIGNWEPWRAPFVLKTF
jgi:hypothetical protein